MGSECPLRPCREAGVRIVTVVAGHEVYRKFPTHDEFFKECRDTRAAVFLRTERERNR